MPFYDYFCEKCDKNYEKLVSVSKKKNLQICKVCGFEMKFNYRRLQSSLEDKKLVKLKKQKKTIENYKEELKTNKKEIIKNNNFKR